MLELEACRIIFPFPPAILNPHQHHSLNGPFPLQPLVELLSVSLSFAINGTLVFKEPTHVHIYIPFTLIVASHICIYWARLILRHSGNSSETLVLKHSIGIWWAWKDCECLASFFFFFFSPFFGTWIDGFTFFCHCAYGTKCSLWREFPAVITCWSIYKWIKSVVCFKNDIVAPWKLYLTCFISFNMQL